MKNIYVLVDDSGIVLTNVVMDEGFSKASFYSFIEKNNFEKVGNGVYLSPGNWADENYILSLRCPNAVFSHEEALYYHGLIDHEPLKCTITVYSGYGTSKLVEDGIEVYTVKKELLDIGKINIVNSFGHIVPMYDLERTVCDLIRSRSRFEIQDFRSALNVYVRRKDKDLNRLIEYAKCFHVEKIIRKYLEVLL